MKSADPSAAAPSLPDQAGSSRIGAAPAGTVRDPYLAGLGERVRAARARRGMTRRGLAQASEVSERHLANLELGTGNASVLLLRQVAQALDCTLGDLLGGEALGTPEGLLIRDILQSRSEDELRRARVALSALFGQAPREAGQRRHRIALIGLRGAGKSTLGQLLADTLDLPFVELNAEIQRVAGCGVAEIHNLYGPTVYRRYERRALEQTIELYPEVVLATPGGLVSEPATFNLLLAHCYTVWLRAEPWQHMQRVVEQGDHRPMAGNDEAMQDLQRILTERTPFYARADATLDTGREGLAQTFQGLCTTLARADVPPGGLVHRLPQAPTGR